MAGEYPHRSVLLQEAVEALQVRSGGVYVDATFGRGGHAEAILRGLGTEGRLLVIDKDPEAIATAHARYAADVRVLVEQGSFAGLERYAEKHGLAGRVDGIVLDLGVSSPQLDDARRGFSFRLDGPLDMRMDPASGVSASEWINSAGEREIADVLHHYGEERFARRIAKAIVQARSESPITTTGRLAKIVAEANPAWERDKHPATRAFQAIRIYINRELDDLEACLPQALRVLAGGGRLAVISFHSLEDRIVKRFMRQEARGGDFPPGVPVREYAFHPTLRLVGKPVYPGEAEIEINPRARSAVLRVAEKL